MKTRMSRRSAIGKMAPGTAAASACAGIAHRTEAAEAGIQSGLKGRMHHSVCRWCYRNMPLEDLCRASRSMGLESVELLEPEEFPVLKGHGLTCAMAGFPTGKTPQGAIVGGIPSAFNRIEHHDTLCSVYETRIPQCADAGLERLICFSGNREGLDDERGMENCAVGLKRILPLAEKHRITLCMELLNSKVDHADYMCDRTAWGVELVKRIASEYFKLLYDIYHMQIMEGDVIATIREHHPCIAHYHTGGVPGRGEIDETQELYYPAIMRAIVETGFKGFVAQEFVPKRPDKLASLKQGIQICDV